MSPVPEVASKEELLDLLRYFHRHQTELPLEELAAVRQKLNARFWEQATAIVRTASKSLNTSNPETIPFPTEELDFLNFGLALAGAGDFEAALQQRLSSMALKPEAQLSFTLLTDALTDAYHKFLKIAYEEKLRSRQVEIATKARELKAQVIASQEQRKDLQTRTVRFDHLEELEALSRQIEGDIIRFYPYKRLQITGGLPPAERKMYLTIRERLLTGIRRREELLNNYPSAAALRDLNRRIQNAIRTHLELTSAHDEIGGKILDVQKERAALSAIDLQKHVLEEARHLQFFTRIAAKRAKVEPQSVLLAEKGLISFELLSGALNELLAFDPDIFNNRQAKHEGMPNVLVIPGSGHGLYDWSRNRLIVPATSPTDIRNSLIQALILYRVDVDKHRHNSELMNSYKNEIKENATIRSMQQLREHLIRDYFLWMNKEARGYQVMPKNTREWFERKIAPNKHDPIIPVEIRRIPSKQLRESIPRYRATMRGGAGHNFVGLILYLIREYEQAMDEFRQAVRCEDAPVEAWFNAGITAKKLSMKEARILWQTYVKKSTLSWWSRKAQEHLRKLK